MMLLSNLIIDLSFVKLFLLTIGTSLQSTLWARENHSADIARLTVGKLRKTP
jgi:hypothetical protein